MPVTGVEGNEREPSALLSRDIAGRRPRSARRGLPTTRIVHLSDTHIAHDSPDRAVALEACIGYISRLEPRPDAVLHTGDIAHNGRVAEYRTARSLLDRLPMPYFVLPGNRDDRRNLAAVFADGRHVRPDMPFVQYAVEDFAVRLIAVDSVNAGTSKGRLCPDRLGHLRGMLEADTARPACLFLHHPPFEVAVGPDPRHFDPWADAGALRAELRRHDHVRGIFCGHVHRGFETAVGGVKASVVSCLADDLRWDRPDRAERGLPVIGLHTFSATAPVSA